MKVSTDDFRRAYAELSDEALQAMSRDELTEAARQCYDEELAHRGLTPEEPEAAAETAEGEDLVEVARFDNTDELDLARALLKSADIPSFLTSDPALPAMWRASRSAWHELFVKSANLEEALEILESEVSDEDLAAQAEAAAPEEDEEEPDEEEEETEKE